MPERGGLGGQLLSLSAPSGRDGCFRGRRSKPSEKSTKSHDDGVSEMAGTKFVEFRLCHGDAAVMIHCTT